VQSISSLARWINDSTKEDLRKPYIKISSEQENSEKNSWMQYGKELESAKGNLNSVTFKRDGLLFECMEKAEMFAQLDVNRWGNLKNK
jgi:hypothetical protein